MPTVVNYDTTYNRDGPTILVNRCVPANADPAILTVLDNSGKIVTGSSPSSSGAGKTSGEYSFDFAYSRNGTTSAYIDIFIYTFSGTRTLYGNFEVRMSELGASLYLAVGISRPSSPLPFLSSVVNPAESSQSVLFFEGFRTQQYFPPASNFSTGTFPGGSCRHTVLPGSRN